MAEDHAEKFRSKPAVSFTVIVHYNQGDEVGASNERCPLTSNFDAKKLRKVKQSELLIAIFSPRQTVFKLIVQGGNTDKSPTFSQRFAGFLVLLKFIHIRRLQCEKKIQNLEAKKISSFVIKKP